MNATTATLASVTATAQPETLAAVTVPLPGPPVDLIAVAGADGMLWQHDEAGIAGRGSAAALQLVRGLDGLSTPDPVAAYLRRIPCDDAVERPGTGAVALAALPFDRRRAGRIHLPSLIVGRAHDGTQWLTLIQPRDERPPLDPAAARQLVDDVAGTGRPEPHVAWSPDDFALTSPIPHPDWCDLVARARSAITAGEFRKVVLAREVRVEANRPFVRGEVLDRLASLHPACMIFALDGFIGASPELLVSRRDRALRSHPLAGTISRSGDAHTDEEQSSRLLASGKDRHEHALVVKAVAQRLQPMCADLSVPDAPAIVALRNVAHLGTEIAGTLRDPANQTALDLVAALHPTPAVGGTPTDAALAFLQEHEGLDRGRYAGAVGWMDSRGDGDWAVAIRSAEVHGARARLFAGVGVVAGSEPDAELAETQLKLQALLAALVRP